MKTGTLNKLLSAKLNPERFQIRGTAIYWLATPTAEETALAADVIANYDTLAAAYQAEQLALASRITYITNRQGKRQLVAMGLYEQVKALIDAAGLEAKIDWDSASGFSRTDPTFLAVKQALNLTDEQEEQFFNEGSKF